MGLEFRFHSFSLMNPFEDMSTSDPDSKDPTLYDPSEEKTEEIEGSTAEQEMCLDIPQELASRLLEVSVHLGLNPSVVASRAIDLICDEIGLVEDQDLSSDTLIQKYQTRLDLIHTLDFDVETQSSEDDQEEGWEAVDRIIEAGERSRYDQRGDV